MKKALMIIDILNDFFKEGLLAEHREQLTTSINQLVDQARLQNLSAIKFWKNNDFLEVTSNDEEVVLEMKI